VALTTTLASYPGDAWIDGGPRSQGRGNLAAPVAIPMPSRIRRAIGRSSPAFGRPGRVQGTPGRPSGSAPGVACRNPRRPPGVGDGFLLARSHEAVWRPRG